MPDEALGTEALTLAFADDVLVVRVARVRSRDARWVAALRSAAALAAARSVLTWTSSMTCGLAGATRWATAFCTAGAKPIFDRAVDVAGAAAVAGPTAAGAAAST